MVAAFFKQGAVWRPPVQAPVVSAPLLSALLGRQSTAPPREATERRAGDPEQCRRSLLSVIENQIIPRLLSGRQAPSLGQASGKLDAADVATLAEFCAAGQREAASGVLSRLAASGIPADVMLTELIGGAARLLGDRWADDRVDFMAVTQGLILMQELIHHLGYGTSDGPQASSALRRVMLASAPGSQHLLGLSIVSEFFRKAGWDVVVEIAPSDGKLQHAVRNEWFDLLGLSVGLDTQLAGLPTLVKDLRHASRNPQVPVMLGGPVFIGQDLRAQSYGAQAICCDVEESLRLADSLIAR